MHPKSPVAPAAAATSAFLLTLAVAATSACEEGSAQNSANGGFQNAGQIRSTAEAAETVPLKGTVVFTYHPEHNSLSALICDSRLTVFVETQVKPRVPAVLHRKGKADAEHEPYRRCRVFWGLSRESLDQLGAMSSAAQKERSAALWKAARSFALAQIPSSGLMLASGGLAWVTASSAFHDITSQMEHLHFQEALQILQNVAPDQMGWTAASLLLFGASRVASVATMARRVSVGLELKQTLALSSFGKAFSSAFDAVAAREKTPQDRKTETRAERAFDADLLLDGGEPLSPDSELDAFLSAFADALTSAVNEAQIPPETVRQALAALSAEMEKELSVTFAQSH